MISLETHLCNFEGPFLVVFIETFQNGHKRTGRHICTLAKISSVEKTISYKVYAICSFFEHSYFFCVSWSYHGAATTPWSYQDTCTVEPLYNEVLGTMNITLLYQVSHIRVKNKEI